VSGGVFSFCDELGMMSDEPKACLLQFQVASSKFKVEGAKLLTLNLQL
jgi:hypothetical protein